MRRINRSRFQSRNRNYFSKLTSLILIILGFILSIYFTVDVIILSHTYHNLGIVGTLSIIGALVGYPMIICGLISLFIKGTSPNSNIETDVSRIRFATEQKMFKGDK